MTGIAACAAAMLIVLGLAYVVGRVDARNGRRAAFKAAVERLTPAFNDLVPRTPSPKAGGKRRPTPPIRTDRSPPSTLAPNPAADLARVIGEALIPAMVSAAKALGRLGRAFAAAFPDDKP